MLFDIRYRVSDTCGNSDSYHVGYCIFDNRKQAEKEFPVGFLAGFDVVEVDIETPREVKRRAEKNAKDGKYR